MLSGILPSLPHSTCSFLLSLSFKIYIVFSVSQGDAIDYQKQLKQMIKDLAKEKDKTEKELPKMSQV